MSELNRLTPHLEQGQSLSSEDIGLAVRELASPVVPDAPKEAFLVAFANKGETAAEVAAFAAAFRTFALDPHVEDLAPKAVDIVGTGGDHAGGFNVSSLVTLVLASAGVPVMKHGNRGITSRCGSADLFSGLGYRLDAPAEKLREGLERLGYVFFFAPAWHPAFKQVGPVRKTLASRGQRTVFNILGPLLNPGRPGHVLLGAASLPLVDKLAGAMDASKVGAGIAVHGIISEGKGIDELTTATVNRYRGAGRLRSLEGSWTAEEFGMKSSPFIHLIGGDVADNLEITERLLCGKAPQGLEDTVVLNAAVCLWMTGKVATIPDGLDLARNLLTGGAVRQKIADTQAFFS